jgi:hypothetical protein
MGEAVRADHVAAPGDFAQHARMLHHHRAYDEEHRLHAIPVEHVENGGGARGMRSIVEGEHDLLVGKRQAAGKLHSAKARTALGVDFQLPAGQRVLRIALGRSGSRAAGDNCIVRLSRRAAVVEADFTALERCKYKQGCRENREEEIAEHEAGGG